MENKRDIAKTAEEIELRLKIVERARKFFPFDKDALFYSLSYFNMFIISDRGYGANWEEVLRSNDAEFKLLMALIYKPEACDFVNACFNSCEEEGMAV